MSSNTRKFVALLVAVGFIVSMAAPAAMAASTDTSGSDATTTTSTLVDGYAEDEFNASADSYLRYEGIVANTTTPILRISLNDSASEADGETFYENASMENLSAGTEGSHWEANFSHSVLGDVPMNAGENVTMDFSMLNKSNKSETLAEGQFYLNNTNERAVVYVGDGLVDEDDDVETTEESSNWYSLGSYGMNPATASAEVDDVGIAGEETEVNVVFGNETFADRYASAADVEGAWYGSTKEGGWLLAQQVRLNGAPLMVFNSEAPEAIEDDDDATYGVYTTAGGQDAISITLGESTYEDEDELDVSTLGNEKYGFGAIYEIKGLGLDLFSADGDTKWFDLPF